VTEAAELFKALSSPSRLGILRLLAGEPLGVGDLVDATGQSQPLVSQHLRILRAADLVASERRGREVIYRIADSHVTHLIEDAIAHVTEAPEQRSEE
jgi:ArsR family transcriptional regulator, zinc-responsive transcriptional repressor